MAPRRTELIGDVGAENARLHGRAVGLQRAFHQPRLGAWTFAKADDALDAGLARPALEPRKLRIVGVEDRRTAALHPEKNFRLGVGDRLERAEEFKMHRLDRGDDRHMRTHEARERLNLTGVVHADLKHRIAGACGTTGKGKRNAPMVVVGRNRDMRCAILGERQSQRVFGAGFPDRASDRDDLRLASHARRAGKLAQAREHVGHEEQRRILDEAAAPISRDDREPRAAIERRTHEVVAVAIVAGDGKEGFAALERAAVDRYAGDACRQRPGAFSAHRRGHRLHAPQRCHAGAPTGNVQLHPAARLAATDCAPLTIFPRQRAGDRLVVAERQHLLADDLAGFMALAGDQQRVA